MSRRLRAFTVVEMLVVISIIALLMALLLPAVQAARETGRRISCANNMAQLGKGLQLYDSSKGNLPPSRSFPAWPAPYPVNKPDNWNTAGASNEYVNWVHFLLPYIKPDSKDQLDTMGASFLNNLAGPRPNVTSIGGQIRVLICSSDLSNGDTPEKLSYACNGGRHDNVNPNPSTLAFDWPANGVFCNRIKGRLDSHRIDEMTLGDVSNGDGTANTIALGENVNVQVWNNMPSEWHACILWRDPADTATAPWIELNKNFINTPAGYEYARPSSYHPNIFQIVMCDGSVKTVAGTIQYPVYMRLMTSNGRKYLEPGLAANPMTPNPIPAIFNVQNTPLSEDDF